MTPLLACCDNPWPVDVDDIETGSGTIVYCESCDKDLTAEQVVSAWCKHSNTRNDCESPVLPYTGFSHPHDRHTSTCPICGVRCVDCNVRLCDAADHGGGRYEPAYSDPCERPATHMCPSDWTNALGRPYYVCDHHCRLRDEGGHQGKEPSQ